MSTSRRPSTRYVFSFVTTEDGGETAVTKQLALPAHLDFAQALYWAKVFTTEYYDNLPEKLPIVTDMIMCARIIDDFTRPTLTVFNDGEKPQELRLYGEPKDRSGDGRHFRIVYRDQNIDQRLSANEALTNKIWGRDQQLTVEGNKTTLRVVDTTQMSWDIRDVDIKFQNPTLKTKHLSPQAQEFITQSGGTPQTAVDAARLMDPSGALTFFRAMRNTRA